MTEPVLIQGYLDDEKITFLYNGRNLYHELLDHLGLFYNTDANLEIYHRVELPKMIVDDHLDSPLSMKIYRYDGDREVGLVAFDIFDSSGANFFPFAYKSSEIWLRKWCRSKEMAIPEIIWPHTVRFNTDADALLFYMIHK